MIAKWTSGYSSATLVERRGVGEAHRDDRVVAGLGERAQTLLASGLGLAVLGLGLLGVGDQALFLGLVETGSGRVVERLVAAAADVVGHADLDVRLRGVRATRRWRRLPPVAVATARREGQDAGRQRLLQTSWCAARRLLRDAVDARQGAGKQVETLGLPCGRDSPLTKLLSSRCAPGADHCRLTDRRWNATATCASTRAPMATARSSTRRLPWCRSYVGPPGVRVPSRPIAPRHPVEVPAEVLAAEALLGRDVPVGAEHPLHGAGEQRDRGRGR